MCCSLNKFSANSANSKIPHQTDLIVNAHVWLLNYLLRIQSIYSQLNQLIPIETDWKHGKRIFAECVYATNIGDYQNYAKNMTDWLWFSHRARLESSVRK